MTVVESEEVDSESECLEGEEAALWANRLCSFTSKVKRDSFTSSVSVGGGRCARRFRPKAARVRVTSGVDEDVDDGQG